MNETRKTHMSGGEMPDLQVNEGPRLAGITALSALIIAGSNTSFGGVVDLFSLYGYWITRLTIAALLFIGAREVIRSAGPPLSDWSQPELWRAAAATVISLPLFTLAITALDIVLGEPEFEGGAGASHLVEFLYEMLYQVDNHIAFCALLTFARPPNAKPIVLEAAPAGFLSTLDPPLDGALLSAEAQEHYVRLTTKRERRLELCRFSDLIRELSPAQGLRVHRSHWVAAAALKSATRSGANLHLTLTTGQQVPVSRTYRKEVEALLAERGIEC